MNTAAISNHEINYPYDGRTSIMKGELMLFIWKILSSNKNNVLKQLHKF